MSNPKKSKTRSWRQVIINKRRFHNIIIFSQNSRLRNRATGSISLATIISNLITLYLISASSWIRNISVVQHRTKTSEEAKSETTPENNPMVLRPGIAHKSQGREAMAKMAHASQSAARLLHRRYGGAIADSTALPRMLAFLSNDSGHCSLCCSTATN